ALKGVMLRRVARVRSMTMYTRQWGTLIEEAQQWDRVLAGGGPSERAAFAAWIKRSPQHLQAYLHHRALELELQGLDASAELDLEALLDRSSSNVVQLPSGMPRETAELPSDSGRRKHWHRYTAVAASCLLALGLILAKMLVTRDSTD